MRRYIFWDFPRATWQYDVVVGLILIFIFAIPREFFRDQPRPASVILIGSSHSGSPQVFIANELLANVPVAQRVAVASNVIHQRMGKNWRVSRVEAIRDESEQEVKGFIAYTSQPN